MHVVRKKTRQVDEPKPEILPTVYDNSFTVQRHPTANGNLTTTTAAVAETANTQLIKIVI